MKRKDFILFMVISGVLGISQSIDGSVFNNFLNDTFDITVMQRTLMEIPREFPGLMVVFMAAVLLFLGDIRTAVIANLLAAFGFFALGNMSSSFMIMVMWSFIYSAGQHLYMPVASNIGMGFSSTKDFGRKLGQISSVNTAVFLVTSLVTFAIFRFGGINYKAAFTVGALGFLLAAILFMFMSKPQVKPRPKKLIFRKQYRLFYILNIVHGARKQIFITFGPWVLIKVFSQQASTFAILGFIIAGIGVFFKPFIGSLIDTKGERFVLASEAIALIVICFLYGFSQKIAIAFDVPHIAVLVVCGCFVVDQLLAATSMARTTYMKKIAVDPDDVSPTLSMGISMDHLVSMLIPFMGAALWNRFGYEYVFLGGMVIACLNLFLTSHMKKNYS